MGRLRLVFLNIILVSFLICSSHSASSQIYDQKVADYILKVDNPGTFLQRLETIGIKEPGTMGLDSAYLWLKKMAEQLGYVTKTQNFLYNSDTLRNIEFVKKGDFDSCIIIGAHYDSRTGSGVNDNGTGDFALYQVAKLLKSVTTKYTIRFVYFSGEEIDYLGSRYYLKTLNKDSVKIKFMLNFDQLGGTIGEDNSGIKCERDEVSSNMAASNIITQSLSKFYSLYTTLNPVITPAYLSDYMSFRDSGYIITGVYQYSFFPYYHSVDDLLKYVEFNSLISTVKGALAFVLYHSVAEVPAGIYSKIANVHGINVYYSNKKLYLTTESNYLISVYDGLGREIYKTSGTNTDKIVPVNKLLTGIYYVLLKTDYGLTYNKFLVEP